MFRELIEEIKRRLKNLESMTMGFDVGEEAIMVETKIQTYESVLELIESYKPKVLDKPDAEGWWWNNSFGDWRACQVYEGSGINGNEWDYPMWADKKGAKWQKAIMPEME